MYKYYIEVTRVIDGDTVDAIIDLGFNTFIKKRIRLHGIDTPEIRTKDLVEKEKGYLAKERLETILAIHQNQAELISHGTGKYGRCLGVIRVKTETDSVNDILLNENLARKWED